MIHNYKCKFCNEENLNHGVRCASCTKYQKDNPQNNDRNKVIDILNRRLTGFEEMIGKEVKSITEDAKFYRTSLIVTFTDNTWVEINAELDSDSCPCGHATLTYNSTLWSKKNLKELKLWED